MYKFWDGDYVNGVYKNQMQKFTFVHNSSRF